MTERKVMLWGDVVGRYVVREADASGRLVLEPDPVVASEKEPSFMDAVEQAANQGRASLDALLASTTTLTEDQAAELASFAARNEEVARAIGRQMRVEHQVGALPFPTRRDQKQ